MVAKVCNLIYLGGRGRRIIVQGLPGKKCKTLSEKLLKTKRAGAGA
jgi:hypothetical protein